MLPKAFTLRAFIAAMVFLALSAAWLLHTGSGPEETEEEPFGGITLGLTAEAQETLRRAGEAFPADQVGFSAYYRVGSPGNEGLNKRAVDNYIFSDDAARRETPLMGAATLKDMGANYTVAGLTIQNVDQLPSLVNIYYDDQGWIVAYLPRGAESSQIWQARALDPENPVLTDAGLSHTLLDGINVVVRDGLGNPEVLLSDRGLGYFHWEHQQTDNFLMLGAALGAEGQDSVAFSVPSGLEVAEVTVTLWVTQDVHAQAACATVSLDGAVLITERCDKGIYHALVDAGSFAATTAHSLQLTQTRGDWGASGVLLMLFYEET